MAAILALDKDALQLELLRFLLGQEGHRVHSAPDPEAALAILQSRLIDLVIVEIALPRQDGFRLCQQIRQLNPYMPLMIVSERRQEEEIVRGLLAAADDYVVKPFSPRELLARVHALLRRANLNRGNHWADENLSIGAITLNLQQMQARVSGHVVRLTPRELTLLHALMENANRVMSREQLMRVAWGDNFVGTAKAVDVYVLRLRRKIAPYLQGDFYIQAQRGFGYKFELPRAQPALVS